MLNIKQKSCEYQLFKFFGLAPPRDRTQVFRLKRPYFTPAIKSEINALMIFTVRAKKNNISKETLILVSTYQAKKFTLKGFLCFGA